MTGKFAASAFALFILMVSMPVATLTDSSEPALASPRAMPNGLSRIEPPTIPPGFVAEPEDPTAVEFLAAPEDLALVCFLPVNRPTDVCLRGDHPVPGSGPHTRTDDPANSDPLDGSLRAL